MYFVLYFVLIVPTLSVKLIIKCCKFPLSLKDLYQLNFSPVPSFRAECPRATGWEMWSSSAPCWTGGRWWRVPTAKRIKCGSSRTAAAWCVPSSPGSWSSSLTLWSPSSCCCPPGASGTPWSTGCSSTAWLCWLWPPTSAPCWPTRWGSWGFKGETTCLMLVSWEKYNPKT